MDCYYCEAKTNCPKKHGQKCPYEDIEVKKVKTKKLKDLTIAEMVELCVSHHKGYIDCENSGCPLWKGRCLKGLIGDLQHLEKEIEL